MTWPITQPAFLGFCPTCNKAFTRETSHNRHISYCRRARSKNKGRLKSCKACSDSKVKCTFAEPACARCEMKGLLCVYGHARQRFPIAQSQSLAASTALPFDYESGELNTTTSLPTLSNDMLEGASFLGTDSMDIFFQDLDTADSIDVNSLITPSYSPLSCLNFSSFEVFPTFSKALEPPNPRGGLPKTALALTRLTHKDLAVDYISTLIIQIITAFPWQMLRHATFPPFIHSYPHLSSLPAKLASCMAIAQLFDCRTKETRPFLGRIIDDEEVRIRSELENGDGEDMKKEEVQYACQALMIYIIMVIVDQNSSSSPCHTARGKRLLTTLEALSVRMHRLMEWQYCSTTEEQQPSKTWDEWIFAESNRRIGCLWFVICRIFTTHDYPCPGFETFKHIPLSSPKSVWEARTEEEWRSEKDICEAGKPFTEFGELIEAKRGTSEAEGLRGLGRWESGCDKMGLLMGFAVVFV
jgi:hypothetical protein